MSPSPVTLEPVAAADHPRFEEVREAIGLYAGIGPEPVPAGAARWIARRGARVTARCTLMTARDLHGAPGATGMIGHYEALAAEDGIALLVHGRDALAAGGVARVLGPINGSTWARYRLALAAPAGDPVFDPPWFLSEPRNPFEYAEHFVAAGFAVAAGYESRLDPDLATAAPEAPARARRVADAGIRVRPLAVERFDAELRALFDLSLASFAANPYYSPIDFDAFRAQYRAMRPLLDPGLVLLAEDDGGTPLAFLFGFVDPESRRAAGGPRAVAKTMATAPAARGRGLGDHLMDRFHQGARERGCRAVIHALMHVDNFSMRISAHHRTRPFRRYALFEWTP